MTNEAALSQEAVEGVTEAFVADAESGSQSAAGVGMRSGGEGGQDGVVEVAVCGCVADGVSWGVQEQVEVGSAPRVIEGTQDKGQRVGGGGGAVLDGQDEVVTEAAQVEVGVAPGVEVGGAAEGETGLGTLGATLPCVVHNGDGDVVATLEVAQIAQQSGDVLCAVLVDAVEADKGIQQQQARAEQVEGTSETMLVAVEVEAEGARGDDLDGETVEVKTAVVTQGQEACLEDGRCVLGEVDQDGARRQDGEATEAGGAAGDGEGEVEAEPGLATLGGPADEADAGAGPQTLDEPGDGAVGRGQVGGGDDLEAVGGRGAHEAFLWTT